MPPDFETRFEPAHDEARQLAPGVRLLTARNPGPFTFRGTNSYMVGTKSHAVIDPGPDDEAHLRALLRALGGRPLTHIMVTHTHADHSPLARRLAERTGAAVLAYGPHTASRPLGAGETNPMEASADTDFVPDIRLGDGEIVAGEDWALRAVHTPGHTQNHMAFALEGSGMLFSGDHVMAWSTTMVAPPDGSMAHYMASLDRLLEHDFDLFLPGHGGAVAQPAKFVRGLKAHRRMRERAIVERLARGDRRISEIVAVIYRDIDPRLRGAAGLSVLAHLEDLAARGVAGSEGPPSIEGVFFLV